MSDQVKKVSVEYYLRIRFPSDPMPGACWRVDYSKAGFKRADGSRGRVVLTQDTDLPVSCRELPHAIAAIFHEYPQVEHIEVRRK